MRNEFLKFLLRRWIIFLNLRLINKVNSHGKRFRFHKKFSSPVFPTRLVVCQQHLSCQPWVLQRQTIITWLWMNDKPHIFNLTQKLKISKQKWKDAYRDYWEVFPSRRIVFSCFKSDHLLLQETRTLSSFCTLSIAYALIHASYTVASETWSRALFVRRCWPKDRSVKQNSFFAVALFCLSAW